MKNIDIISVGDSITTKNASWSFSGNTVEGFENHVSKSIPFYDAGHNLILGLSDFFLSENSICYEIGCSTGTLSQKIAEHNSGKNLSVIGIDVEKDMIKYARDKTPSVKGLEFICGDISEIDLKKSDLIIAYYTVQFIKPRIRQLVIDQIYNSLNWGGAFILFEKVRACDARFQDVMTSLYIDYKINQGYNSDEIISKSRSLKGILEPFSTQGNIDLLKRAGFVDIMSVMKYVSFEGFLAIK